MKSVLKCSTRVLSALGLVTILSTMVLAPQVSFASEKKTCKVTTNDIGTIIGHGKTGSDAFEDAATQCFDRRAEIFRTRRGHEVDEDAGLTMIDICANIKCS